MPLQTPVSSPVRTTGARGRPPEAAATTLAPRPLAEAVVVTAALPVKAAVAAVVPALVVGGTRALLREVTGAATHPLEVRALLPNNHPLPLSPLLLLILSPHPFLLPLRNPRQRLPQSPRHNHRPQAQSSLQLLPRPQPVSLILKPLPVPLEGTSPLHAL